MSLWVHALVPARSRFAAKGMRLVRGGAVAAVVSDRFDSSATRARLLAYDRTLRRIADATGALVPVRFNTRFDSEAELKDVLRARQATLRRMLAHVRRRVQMTVRIPSAPTTARREALNSGADYLRARLEARRVVEFESLLPAVERWVRDEQIERRGGIASIHHLVPASAPVAYTQALETAAAAAGVNVMVTGPFLPYAFAEAW